MAWTLTNIEIENDYVDAIIVRFGVRTKTEAVDLALRHLAGDPMSREEALAMRGAHAIDALPTDTLPTDTPPADHSAADALPADHSAADVA